MRASLDGSVTSRSTLLPIRLDIEENGWSVHESFLWSTDSNLTVSSFVHTMVNDLKLPLDSATVIIKRIQSQILALRTVWDNKLAQLAAMKKGVVPCVKVFQMQVNLGTSILVDRFEWYVLGLVGLFFFSSSFFLVL